MSRHIRSRRRRIEIAKRRQVLEAVLFAYRGYFFENPVAMRTISVDAKNVGSYHGVPGHYLCWDAANVYLGWRARLRDALTLIVDAELRRRND